MYNTMLLDVFVLGQKDYQHNRASTPTAAAAAAAAGCTVSRCSTRCCRTCLCSGRRTTNSTPNCASTTAAKTLLPLMVLLLLLPVYSVKMYNTMLLDVFVLGQKDYQQNSKPCLNPCCCCCCNLQCQDVQHDASRRVCAGAERLPAEQGGAAAYAGP
jgi:hypothetical protein